MRGVPRFAFPVPRFAIISSERARSSADRAPASGAVGRGFKSLRARQIFLRFLRGHHGMKFPTVANRQRRKSRADTVRPKCRSGVAGGSRENLCVRIAAAPEVERLGDMAI